MVLKVYVENNSKFLRQEINNFLDQILQVMKFLTK